MKVAMCSNCLTAVSTTFCEEIDLVEAREGRIEVVVAIKIQGGWLN